MITLNENDYGKAVSYLPFGSYYLKELSTNAAYILNDMKFPVVFEYAGKNTALFTFLPTMAKPWAMT